MGSSYAKRSFFASSPRDHLKCPSAVLPTVEIAPVSVDTRSTCSWEVSGLYWEFISRTQKFTHFSIDFCCMASIKQDMLNDWWTFSKTKQKSEQAKGQRLCCMVCSRCHRPSQEHHPATCSSLTKCDSLCVATQHGPAVVSWKQVKVFQRQRHKQTQKRQRQKCHMLANL